MYDKRSLLERCLRYPMMELGTTGVVGISGMLAAALLLLVWIFLFRKHHKPFYLLAGAVVFLAVSGYVAFERDHVLLNLTMRDSSQVTKDCLELMERSKALHPGTDQWIRLYKDEELPVSFTRMGTKAAIATPDHVQICFYADPFGGAWGFLFDPPGDGPSTRRPDVVRPTWYRDFYEFRVVSE